MESFGIIGIAIVIIVLVLVLIIIYEINKIIRKIKSITAYTGNISQIIEEQEKEIEITPKSVNGMTSVYLPKIKKDFPEFNYEEFKVKSENMLKSMFDAVTDGNLGELINASNDLKYSVSLIIESNINNRVNEVYKDVVIHQTEIKDYIKQSGTCVITLQSSVGYKHYKKSYNGEVTEGSESVTMQTRYNTKLLYVQDEIKYGEHVNAKGLTCPNCGAPITNLGAKICTYCGSGVVEINIKSWSIFECEQV